MQARSSVFFNFLFRGFVRFSSFIDQTCTRMCEYVSGNVCTTNRVQSTFESWEALPPVSLREGEYHVKNCLERLQAG